MVLLISTHVIAQSDNQDCQKVLNWIYKDLTLKNLDKSVDRLNKKIQLSFLHALDKTNNNFNLKDDPELLSIYESLSQVDSDFESYLSQHKPYKRYESWSWWWWNSVPTSKISYKEIAKKWRSLQRTRPNLFSSLPSHLKIDDWDIATGDILDKAQAINITDQETKKKFQRLAGNYEKNYQELISPKSGSLKAKISQTKKSVEEVQLEMKDIISEIIKNNGDKYQNLCAQNDLLNLLSNDSLVCSLNDVPGSDLPQQMSLLLSDLSNVIDPALINNTTEPVVPVIDTTSNYDNVTINPMDYKNINYAGSYCERDKMIVDTAVIHHTATSNQFDAQDINDTQVVAHENDTDANGNPDPWYMIAYNYAIAADYNSNDISIYQGRPDNLKGAHAGAYINTDQLDPVVQELVKNYQFKCGYNTDKDKNHIIDKRDYKTEKKYRKDLANGKISANMTTVGVSVIGNYMPDLIPNGYGGFSSNPSGYPSNGDIRYPTEESLKKVGQLICKLKKETHPHLRKITDHNFIKIKKQIADGDSTSGTCCPGTVYYKMNQIRKYAMEACNFTGNEFVLDISPKVRLCRGLRDL